MLVVQHTKDFLFKLTVLMAMKTSSHPTELTIDRTAILRQVATTEMTGNMTAIVITL